MEILDTRTGLTYDSVNDILLGEEFKPFTPQNFLLTTRDGTKYYFNLENGLYKVEDNYGKTIEITDDGVFYSDGTGIDSREKKRGYDEN